MVYLPYEKLDQIESNVLNINEMENNYILGLPEWKIIIKNIDLLPREKRSLYLYYWMGFTQDKISRIMKIHRSQISRSIKKAKEKIAKYFKKESILL